jgi:hypothetical protein
MRRNEVAPYFLVNTLPTPEFQVAAVTATMGDYFDDDDLINDYTLEDFVPPPEYYDEFVLEEPDIAGSTDKKPGEDPMDVDPPQDDAEDSDMNEQGVPNAVHVTIPRPNTDVYSFERQVSLFHLDWRRGARVLVSM